MIKMLILKVIIFALNFLKNFCTGKNLDLNFIYNRVPAHLHQERKPSKSLRVNEEVK